MSKFVKLDFFYGYQDVVETAINIDKIYTIQGYSEECENDNGETEIFYFTKVFLTPFLCEKNNDGFVIIAEKMEEVLAKIEKAQGSCNCDCECCK